MIRKQSMTIMFALAFMIFTPIAASAQTTPEVVPVVHQIPTMNIEANGSIFTVTWDLEKTDDFVGFEGRYYVQALNGTVIEDWQNFEKVCPNDFGGSCGPFIETATGAMYLHGHQNTDVLKHCVEITANFANDSTMAIDCAVSQVAVPTPISGDPYQVIIERNQYKIYPGDETVISGYVVNYIATETDNHEIRMKITQKGYKEFVYLPLDEQGRYEWRSYIYESEKLTKQGVDFRVAYEGVGAGTSVLKAKLAPTGPDDFRVELSTDKDLYTRDEPIIVTASVFNMANSEHFQNGDTGMYVSIRTLDSDVKRFIVPHQIFGDGDTIYKFDFPEEFAVGTVIVEAITKDQKFRTTIHVSES